MTTPQEGMVHRRVVLPSDEIDASGDGRRNGVTTLELEPDHKRMKRGTRRRQACFITALVLLICVGLVIVGRKAGFATPPKTPITDADLVEARRLASIRVEDLPRLSVQSSHACYNLPGGSGVLDVLGSAFTTAHYCVLKNVCIRDGQWRLFDKERAGVAYEFPRQALLQGTYTAFEDSRSASTASRLWHVRAALHDYQPLFEPGVTVLLRHAYCCAHIRHFLEPLASLRMALADLANNSDRRAFVADAPLSIDRVVIARPSSEGGQLTDRNRLVLQAALLPPPGSHWRMPAISAIPIPHDGQPLTVALGARCFETAIVPGAEYHVFYNQSDARDFRDAVFRLLTPLKWERFGATGDRWWVANERPDRSGFAKDPRERVVLVSLRSSKRSVIDMPVLLGWIADFVKPFGAVVKTIDFGAHSPESQATHAQEADVLVGMHGADLTNVMFQREGAALVELNPIFFFESGYYEMARRLGVHYFAWTCTAPSCAFASDRTHWDRVFGPGNGVDFNATTLRFGIRGTDIQNATYPALGYPGRCGVCDRLPGTEPFKNHFYGTMRDSDVLVASHQAEFAELFSQVLTALRWR